MMAQETLEGMIFKMWTDCVDAAADYNVPVEAVQKLIADTRKVATDAGWPAIYTHNFFVELARILKQRTLGHPTTLQIIRLLEIETEFN